MTAPWSVNRRAVDTVCRHAHDAADARLLLDMIGLVGGPTGREVLPDDTRVIVVEFGGASPGAKNPDAFADSGRRPEGMTTPPGLANLPPAAAKAKRKPARPKAPRKRTVDPALRVRRAIAECGTPSGYERHRRLKEPTCPQCRAARAAVQRAYTERKAS